MAWTAPMTATDNSIWTSAQFNSGVRDNLVETMPGKATGAGGWFVTETTNKIVQRAIAETVVLTSETTASTTYANLATVGPVSASTATGTKAIVFFAANATSNTANTNVSVSVAVSGATTVAASDSWRACSDGQGANDGSRLMGWYYFGATGAQALTAGNNTFTVKYKTSAGTATFVERSLLVMAL